MSSFIQDLRHGLRGFLKKPGFTSVAVVTLALGIGANTAIFSVVNAVLLRPLPFPDSDRLVILWQKSRELPVMMVSYPDFLDYRRENRVFEEIALYNRYQNKILTGTDRPERLSTAVVTSGLFKVLGIRPVLGRGFLPEEDLRGSTRAAILSHGLWQRRFGGDRGVLGRALTLGGEPHVVVGVLPPDLQFLAGIDLWVPVGTFVSDNLLNRGVHNGMVGVARLKKGVTLDRARSEMETICGRLERQYPGTNAGVGVAVNRLQEVRVGDARPALLLILGAVGFVLLIACANVANLLLARAAARRKEMAVRAALGADRGRMLRQHLTESTLLALCGGGLGLLLALWGVDGLRSWGSQFVPRAGEIDVDARVLTFTAVAAILTGILVGLVPALRASRTNLIDALNEGGRSESGGRERHRARSLLVVFEMALSFVLLIGAGLLIRSLALLQGQDPGFAPENVLTLRVALPEAKFPTDEDRRRFFRQVLERAAAVPGVETVAWTGNLPFSEDGWQTSYSFEGRPDAKPGQEPLLDTAQVSPGYFRTLRIPVLKGRAFTAQDTAEAPAVAVVSESFVRRFWPGENPLGRRIKMGRHDDPGAWMTVVGVVGDTKRITLERALRPEVYLPDAQITPSMATLVARTTVEPASVGPGLARQVLTVDEDQPVYGVQTMEERLASSLEQRRFSMILLGAFAGLALLLAAVGLYGVISQSVAQRTHEIGIRIAIGASRGDVLKLVLRQGMALALIGSALGAAGALALSRVVTGLLFGIEPTDPFTFAGVAALLLSVACAACYVPARRATRVDPMAALHAE